MKRGVFVLGIIAGVLILSFAWFYDCEAQIFIQQPGVRSCVYSSLALPVAFIGGALLIVSGLGLGFTVRQGNKASPPALGGDAHESEITPSPNEAFLYGTTGTA